MSGFETATLSREEAEDFVALTLSEIGTRSPSKHQESPFVSRHMALYACPKYMRGSDLTERLYVSVEALKKAGHTQTDAIYTVVGHAKKFLSRSKRGRPRLTTTKPDELSLATSIRNRVNAFAKRKQFNAHVVEWRVQQFLWNRRVGIIRGSQYDPNSGARMREAWLARIRELWG